MSKTLVIAHKNCFDGFGAAWVCWHKFGDDAEYVFASYGDPVEFTVEGKDVYIVDFSYPREVLEDMKAHAHSLTVLDHHKSAQAALEGLDYCIFDMDRSGAQLAWDHLHVKGGANRPFIRSDGSYSRPSLVDYIGDRDLWRFQYPETKAIHAWLASYPKDFRLWDRLSDSLHRQPEVVVEAGRDILRAHDQQVREMVKEAQFATVGGHIVPAVNCPYQFGSDVGNMLCQAYPDLPFAAYYFDRADGEQQWGLRSIGDFDVSEIAKQYGGGGHKNAAGFIKGKASRTAVSQESLDWLAGALKRER